MEETIYIDGEFLILGRLGTQVATRLIEGYNVEIVNAEKIIISGNPKEILTRYQERFKIRTKTTPWRGPFHYRRPDMFVRRSIRGMLPWKKPSGKAAYHRLKVHIGVPNSLKEKSLITYEEADGKRLNRRFMKISDLCERLGWNNAGMEK